MSAWRDPGPLAEAALAVEEEVRRLDAVAREAQALPLTSRRNLRRTAEKLAELANAEERLRPRLETFAAAFAELGERQRGAIEALQARTVEVQRRREALAALLGRFGELGLRAREMNESVQRVAGRVREGVPPPEPELRSMGDAAASLAADAEGLCRAAADERFGDLAQEIDALRQQLLAVRHRLDLARERAAPAP